MRSGRKQRACRINLALLIGCLSTGQLAVTHAMQAQDLSQLRLDADRQAAHSVVVGMLKGHDDFRKIRVRLRAGDLPVDPDSSSAHFTISRHSPQRIDLDLNTNTLTNGNARDVHQVSYRFFETDIELITSLFLGKVDYAVLFGQQQVKIITGKGATNLVTRLVRIPENTVDMLVFNLKHPVLRFPEVRQAISYAINTSAILEDILENQGSIAGGSPYEEDNAYFPGSGSGLQRYKYSPRRTTLLLKNQGWSRNRDGIYQRNGRILEFTLAFQKGVSLEEKIARRIKRDLNKRGIVVNLHAIHRAELNDRLAAGEYEALLWQHHFEMRDYAVYDFFMNPRTSFIKFKDIRAQRAFTHANRLGGAKPSLDRIQVIINQSCVATFLFFRYYEYHLFNNSTVSEFLDPGQRYQIKPFDSWRLLKSR